MLRTQGIGYENHEKIHKGCNGPWIIESMVRRIVGDVGKKNKAFEAMKDVKKDMMGVRNANVLIGET